jgi:hypothetical protein
MADDSNQGDIKETLSTLRELGRDAVKLGILLNGAALIGLNGLVTALGGRITDISEIVSDSWPFLVGVVVASLSVITAYHSQLRRLSGLYSSGEQARRRNFMFQDTLLWATNLLVTVSILSFGLGAYLELSVLSRLKFS